MGGHGHWRTYHGRTQHGRTRSSEDMSWEDTAIGVHTMGGQNMGGHGNRNTQHRPWEEMTIRARAMVTSLKVDISVSLRDVSDEIGTPGKNLGRFPTEITGTCRWKV